MRSGGEIQGDLRKFVARWRDYSGSERSEAQTFLNELIHCYGADRKAVGARFEDAHTATGIMDLHWPAVCIVEMKAPHRAAKLATGTDQEPLFGDSYKELTTEAAKVVVKLYQACSCGRPRHRRRCARSSCKPCGACSPRISGCLRDIRLNGSSRIWSATLEAVGGQAWHREYLTHRRRCAGGCTGLLRCLGYVGHD